MVTNTYANGALNLPWCFDNRMSEADIDGDGATDVTYQFDETNQPYQTANT